MYPISKNNQFKHTTTEISFDFKGTGFALQGSASKKAGVMEDYIFDAELYVGGVKIETAKLPTNFFIRHHALFWKYLQDNKKHTVVIKIINPKEG